MSDRQHTLAAPISFSGRGLHTGAESAIQIRPADADAGFRFVVGETELVADPAHADGSRHRTVLRAGDIEVHTIEHLLAALFGMGVDNATIEVTGGEIPGMDGSASPFAQAIRDAGLAEQDAPRRILTLKQPVSVSQGDAMLTAFPSKDGAFRVTYLLHYPESKLAQGVAEYVVTPESVLGDISPCRTFVMKAHAEAMLKAGHGQGASTSNTLVLAETSVVENQLRFDDECARHKVLDVVGDLATLGAWPAVHVVAYRSGHALNLQLVRELKKEMARQSHPRGVLDIREIERLLPHRYPFLLVDRVVEMEPRKRIRAYKNLTRNEDFFNGHFPGQPIMPGVLQVEALAQTGGVLLMREPECQGKLAVLMAVEDVKYRRPVVPGDRLDMEVELVKIRGRIGIVQARSSVDGETATECGIKFALVEPSEYT